MLALRHQALPAPTLHVDAPTPEVDWSSGVIRLLTDTQPWPSPSPAAPAARACPPSGLSGTNAHLILEEPPQRAVEPVESPAEDALLPFVLTAGSPDRLAALADRLADFAERGTAPLSSLAAALAHGRTRHRVADHRGRGRPRRARGRVADAGREWGRHGLGRRIGHPDGVPLPGSGRPLGRDGAPTDGQFTDFIAWVRRCDALLDEYELDWTLEQALGENDLSRVDVIQPSSFVMMTGLAQLWASAGVVPDVVLGASQGEIAAACVAGALSVEDALRAIVLRSRMAAALPSTGGMIVVGVSRARMTEMLAGQREGRWRSPR